MKKQLVSVLLRHYNFKGSNMTKLEKLEKELSEVRRWLDTHPKVFNDEEQQEKFKYESRRSEIHVLIKPLREQKSFDDSQSADAAEHEADIKQSATNLKELEVVYLGMKTLLDGNSCQSLKPIFKEIQNEYLRRVELLNG